MKNTVFYLVLFLSLSCLPSCAPPDQPTAPVQHTDPINNINDDYPLLHLPMIKPIEAKRRDESRRGEYLYTMV